MQTKTTTMLISTDSLKISLGLRFAYNKYPSFGFINHRKRFYASTSKGNKDYSLISNTLRLMDSSFTTNGFIANNDTQRFIESFVYNEFSSSVVVKPNYVAHVDTNILGVTVSSYINSKVDILNTYVDSLFEVTKQDAIKSNSNKITACLTYEILCKIGKPFILSICIHHFLIILTYQHTENDNYTNLLAISIKIGKLLVQKYLVELNTINKSDIRPSYSSFLTT